jgi:hypothetical protein
MLLDGTAIIGVAGLIKDKAAITNKLQANKVNVAATAKAKFAKKQHLQTESSRKISTVVEEKVSMRIQQRSIGNARTYKELTKNAPDGGFNDGREAHHIPSKAFMEKHGISRKEGLAVMMTNEQHDKTRTSGSKAKRIDPNANPRDELAKDLRDVRKILQEDGDYKLGVNRKMLKEVKNHESKYPNLFKKEEK